MRRFDLIIVGASFAGLACARTAASRGLKVCVIERKTDPGLAVRTTGILVKEAAEETDIPSHLTRLIRGVRLYAPNGKSTDHAAPGYYFLASDTPNLLRWMAEEARRAGAVLMFGTAFKRAEQTSDAVMLPDLLLQARLLIGADGATSASRMASPAASARMLSGMRSSAISRWIDCCACSSVVP